MDQSCKFSFLLEILQIHKFSCGGSFQVVDGFLCIFVAPKSAKVKAGQKEIIFVLDKSGSTVGTKFDQIKAAMKKILSELREEDLFNIVIFSSGPFMHHFL